jgi:hypothetical protein
MRHLVAAAISTNAAVHYAYALVVTFVVPSDYRSQGIARRANPALRSTSASGTVKDGYTPASTFHGPGREAASQPGASPCVSNALLWCSRVAR